MTPYQQHVANWKECTRCPLHKGRGSVVISRGKIPADVLFLGEAPGESEDTLGFPFVGPAGILLDRIISRSVPKEIRFSVTNLVCCMPRDEEKRKASQPLPEEVESCSPRLREFIILCRPKLIVCVGKLAQEYTDHTMKRNIWARNVQLARIKRIAIDHPAYILRMNVAQRGLALQRAMVIVQNAIEEMLESINKQEPLNATKGIDDGSLPGFPTEDSHSASEDDIPF